MLPGPRWPTEEIQLGSQPGQVLAERMVILVDTPNSGGVGAGLRAKGRVGGGRPTAPASGQRRTSYGIGGAASGMTSPGLHGVRAA